MIEIFFDHETHLIARMKLAPKPVCTSWARDDEPVEVCTWRDTPAREWLSDSSTVMIGANTSYDAGVQMAADTALIPLWVEKYCDGKVRDIQLDSKLLAIAEGSLYEGRSFSLAAVVEPLGMVLEKDHWRTRYAALDGVEIQYYPEGAVTYSKDDTVATRLAHRHHQRAHLQWEQNGLTVLGQHAYLAAAAAWCLHLASCHGVLTDPARTRRLGERVSAHLDEIRGDLVSAGLIVGGKVKALAGHARMVEVMTAKGRRREITLSDTWQARYDARVKAGEDPAIVHEELLGTVHKGRGTAKLDRDCAILSGDEMLVRRADYVSSSLLFGRCERMREGHVYPLQTRFHSLQETFRTSSSQPDEDSGLVGEQMQNFPRGKKEDTYGLREAFCPRNQVPYVYQLDGTWDVMQDEGVFIGADYSMFELHALAQVCFRLFGWSKMGQLLNAGVDVHWHFAAKSLGISIEQVKALVNAADQRDRAKPLNFGVPGGMGPDKIRLYSRKSYGVTFAREEVVILRKIWLYDAFPEVPEMFKWTNSQLQKRKSFTHVHPITGYVRGGCGYTDGNNENFQHLAAYAAKVAMVEITRACFTPGDALFGWRMWNFVHDEFLLEGPRRGASAAANRLASIMVTTANRFMPDFPCHAEPFITKVWSKKCKSLVDAQGNVLEWKPKPEQEVA